MITCKDLSSSYDYGMNMLEELIKHFGKHKSISVKDNVNEKNPDVSVPPIRR